MKKFLCFFIIAASAGPLVSQTYTPVTVSGFNLDGVAETAPNSLTCTTQALDQVVAGGNSVMYSVGFATTAGFTGGLPNSGTITSGLKSYQLESYTGNNTLFAPSGTTNTLTLSTPSQYSAISLLVFSTEGASSITVTINYTDLTSSSAGLFSIQDWFGGTGAIISGIGRCKRVTSGATFDGVSTNNPRFYSLDINLTCPDQQKLIESITIGGVSSNPAGGGAYVMAVSGIPYISDFTTISYAVSAFCQQSSAETPTITGPTGGTFSSSPSGLTINPTSGTVTFPTSSANSYSITYTPSAPSCALSSSFQLDVLPTPSLTVNSPTVCPGAPANLMASSSIPGGTFLWLPTGEVTSNITVTPSTPTSYTVQYTTANGCSAEATTTVEINNVITMSVNSATICSGDAAILTAVPSSPGGNYVWTPGNITTSAIAVSPMSTTVYTVDYTVSSCSAQSTATVTVIPTPTISFGSANLCTGETATLTANASPAGGNYIWSPGGQTTPDIIQSPAATSNYTVSYALNGCSASASGQITVNPYPVISVTASSDSIFPMQAVSIVATGGGSYVWSTGATTAILSLNPSQTAVYCVTVTTAGCQTSDCLEIAVGGQSVLQFPNVFTPNGDGVNDVFITPNFNLSEYQLTIFNRWGERVFESDNALKGWDGSIKGHSASDGTYLYTLQAKGYDGVDYKKSGHITLIR